MLFNNFTIPNISFLDFFKVFLLSNKKTYAFNLH